jgi:membrane protease YdiL (CAAX protease family)
MLPRLLAGSLPVIAALVAAAFVVPASVPAPVRQTLLGVVGIGGIAVAERMLFGPGWRRTVAALGFVAPRPRAVAAAVVASLPMWLFLPGYGWLGGERFPLDRDWPGILLGVILVNGIAEEVIHRAFIFGHLREIQPFRASATRAAVIFGLQHLYLLVTTGAVAGTASVLLALVVAFPLAFLYERGGNSLAGPAILHSSSNAPMMLFVIPDTARGVLLPHIAVVMASMCLIFAFRRWLPDNDRGAR